MVAITILDKANANWLAAAATKCNELIPVRHGDDQHIHSSKSWVKLRLTSPILCSLFRHTSASVDRSISSIAVDWTLEWLLPVLLVPLLICFICCASSYGLFKWREVVITSGWEAQSGHSVSIHHRLSHYNVSRSFFSYFIFSLCVKRLTCSTRARTNANQMKHVSCLDLVRLWQLIFI